MTVKTRAPECCKRADDMRIVSAVLLSALAVGSAWAQPPGAAEFQRATTTRRLAEFPKIHRDGLDVVNPDSDTLFRNGIKTAAEVPLPGENYYDLKDVPPGYDSSPRLRYPVLYLQHAAGPDLSSYLGIFSGTPMAQAQAQADAVVAQGAAFGNKLRLLWFGVGTTEASFCTRAQDVGAQWQKAGIPSGYHESPGAAHEFQTWRRCLHEFAPLPFRAAASPAKKK
jgi:hypothetical protein